MTMAALLGMAWLVAHILTTEEGPHDIHRYFFDNHSHLIDLSIDVNVVQREGEFEYRYLISNGWLSIHKICDLTFAAQGEHTADFEAWFGTYEAPSDFYFGRLWDRKMKEAGECIGRGQNAEIRVFSKYPPTIVKVQAGTASYSDYKTKRPDATTPAGRRSIRFTIIPRRDIPFVPSSPERDAWSRRRSIERAASDIREAISRGWIQESDDTSTLFRRLKLASTDNPSPNQIIERESTDTGALMYGIAKSANKEGRLLLERNADHFFRRN